MEFYNDMETKYEIKKNAYIIAELCNDKENMKAIYDEMVELERALNFFKGRL